jgi:hypothetical protein
MLPRPQAQAQHNATLYFMRDLPLANTLNPAFQPEAGSLYIGIPGLSSIYLDGGIIARGASIVDLPLNFSTFKSGNANIEVSLLNLGVLVRDMYFTLDVTTKTNVKANVPESFVKMVWYGNTSYLGQDISLVGLSGQAQAYTEFALGFSKEVVRNRITVGGKVKYLMGHVFGEGYLGHNSFIHTDPETWYITAEVTPELYVAGLPVKAPRDTIDINSFQFENGGSSYSPIAGNGGGIDLGFEIKGEKLTISGSLTDLGFISWKNAEYVKGHGITQRTFTGVINDNGNMIDQLRDSLYSATQLYGSSITSLHRWIDPTMSFSTSYRLHQNFSVGALAAMTISRYNDYPLFALSVSTHKLPVNGTVSYSYSNNHNLGLGLLFGRRGVQFHLICDNVLAANFHTARHFNLRTGLNLLLGSPKNTDPRKKAWEPLNPMSQGDPPRPKVKDKKPLN